MCWYGDDDEERTRGGAGGGGRRTTTRTRRTTRRRKPATCTYVLFMHTVSSQIHLLCFFFPFFFILLFFSSFFFSSFLFFSAQSVIRQPSSKEQFPRTDLVDSDPISYHHPHCELICNLISAGDLSRALQEISSYQEYMKTYETNSAAAEKEFAGNLK